MISRLRDRIERELERKKLHHGFRELKVSDSEHVDFSSNDYLGLARSEVLQQEVFEKLNRLERGLGSGGSRLLSGNTVYHEALEADLADFFKAEGALLFNSGYNANLAILSSLPKRGDTILYDELSHACIKDGVRLSMAQFHKFRHNDLNDLEHKLSRAKGQIFIVVEGIYSMDGDMSPLREIMNLAGQYDAEIIIDEAHSTGLFKEGKGYSVDLGLEDKLFARVYTFGKAIGSHGACIVGCKSLIDYLINASRPFIYTTAMPAHQVIAIQYAFHFLQKHQFTLLGNLDENIEWFCEKADGVAMKSEGWIMNPTPIQGFVLPDNFKLKSLAQSLSEEGFDVRPILSPTVSEGTERLRIILHAFNTKNEIEQLVSAIQAL